MTYYQIDPAITPSAANWFYYGASHGCLFVKRAAPKRYMGVEMVPLCGGSCPASSWGAYGNPDEFVPVEDA